MTGDERTRPTRREFLAGLGFVGAGMIGAPRLDGLVGAGVPGQGRQARLAGARGAPASPANFGRLFPDLDPFAPATDTVRAALIELGAPGGILDARDDLAAGAKALIVDPAVNGNPTAGNAYGTNPDNPTMTAGSSFVGQFIDHDITFDQSSLLGVTQDPLRSPNSRTSALDLDSVFGGGPAVRPDLYVANADGSVGPQMKIGSGGAHEDLPRVANGDGTYSVLVADLRNDEHLMIAGLQAAHILFYNRVLAELGQWDLGHFPEARADGGSMGHIPTRPADGAARYLAHRVARQVTQWHYQWLAVNEHLVQLVGRPLVEDVLRHGNRLYRPPRHDTYVPIEFSAAAYRVGHSMVRPSYRANFTSGTGDSTSPVADPFFGLVFDPEEPGFSGQPDHDRADLLGGYPARRRYIGWQTFFDFGDGQVKNNKKIDTTISTVMFDLPVPAIPPHTQTAPTSLPQRNLLRQLTWGLPSGQDVAKAMGAEVLGPRDLGAIGDVYAPFVARTPLWYYIMAEAEVATGGLTLGPAGGRIVAETLIGLLRGDPASYLSVRPDWHPFLGADLTLGPQPAEGIAGDRSYTHAHFLYYAGVASPSLYR